MRYFSKQAGQQFQSVREQYMCNVTKNIKKRIPKSDSKIMTSLGQLLEPSAVNVASTDKTDKALEILIEHYGSEKIVKTIHGDQIVGYTGTEKTCEKIINGEELVLGWPGVMGMIKGAYKHLSLQDLCLRLLVKHQQMCPNMAKIGAIALCMQVTSVECERSFNTQNRIKSKFR